MEQFNPGLRNLINLGKSYEKSVTGGYFLFEHHLAHVPTTTAFTVCFRFFQHAVTFVQKILEIQKKAHV